MDLRRMALIDAPITKVSATTMDAFRLGADRLQALSNLLPRLRSLEFWDPEYQAWKPFLDSYLSSGVNPQYTKEYYAGFVQKADYLEAPPAAYSDLFADILKLKNTSGSILFEGFFYTDIQSFCENQCKFFVNTQKSLVQQLYSPDLYIQTLSDLLNVGTWKAVMCALVLYRHCQIENFSWTASLILQLQEKLGEWLETFLKHFDEITEFVRNNQKGYSWYQPRVLEVIRRTWSSSLQIEERPLVITDKDVYSISSEVATKLVEYVNSCPAVYDDPFDEQTVWDSMSALFYSSNPQAKDFSVSAYKALCVPRNYFKRMCNTLYDFYWTVADNQLTSQLYTRCQVGWSTSPSDSREPGAYLEELYNHGFPTIVKE